MMRFFKSPLKMELPLFLRLEGSAIMVVWWQVLLVLLYTTGLVCLHKYVDGITIDSPQRIIYVMGVSIGLLLFFRTFTAYDKYWEGRKLWSKITLNIRNLTRCIWTGVEEKEKTSREVIEKASAVNLLIAFAYATRNYLRGDYSYDENDLRELISHIPRLSKLKNSNEHFGDQLESEDKSIKAPAPVSVPPTIPIELSYYIASYINNVQEKELVEGSTVGAMNSALNNLVDCLAGFEKILRTPIPLAYSVHLHHATWIYLLALPFQLICLLEWYAIPALGLASFALLGILGIAWEIENPFGLDPNDLPLDDYCKVIHIEAMRIIRHRMPAAESWLISDENHPLSPQSTMTATSLMKLEKENVLEILKKGCHIRLSAKTGRKNNDLRSVSVVGGNGSANSEEK